MAGETHDVVIEECGPQEAQNIINAAGKRNNTERH